MSIIKNKYVPLRKYRIGIHSRPTRTIPIHSDICIRTNVNQSEPIRKTFCIVWWKTVKNRSDLIRFNPRHQSEWTRTNPKPSFQSRSMDQPEPDRFSTVFHQTSYKTFFWLARNEFLTDTFARVALEFCHAFPVW